MNHSTPISRLRRPGNPDNRETLERVLRWPSLADKWAGRAVRIWCGEVRGFWRPRAAGYTADVALAGTWEFDEAVKMTQHCGTEKCIEFHRPEKSEIIL